MRIPISLLLGLVSSLGFAKASPISDDDSFLEDASLLAERSENTSAASDAAIWQPPMKSQMQWVLSGIPDVDAANPSIAPKTGIYEIDLFYAPNETIQLMKQLGQKVICYFSAATAENWRDDYSQFQAADFGKALPDWQGENYLDIRRPNVLKVMSKRIQLAYEKGCDAIEPDNIDVYSNDNGLYPPITMGDSVAYLDKISQVARNRSLAVGIKNCIEILGPIFPMVDFAISEECVIYSNCTAYANFTVPTDPKLAGKPVYEFEYVNYTYYGDYSDDGTALDPTAFEISNVAYPGLRGQALRNKLCSLDHAGATLTDTWLKINSQIKTLDLDGWIMFCDGSVQKTKTKDVSTQRSGGGSTNAKRVTSRRNRISKQRQQ